MKTYLILLTLLLLSNTQATVIMIDPAGHAKDPGRQLHHNYERAQTYKCAEALRDALEKKPGIKVLITRVLGEEIVPLQNASFANRMQVDCFIRLHFYKQSEAKPSLSVYHHVTDPTIDFAKRNIDVLAFRPLDQAHYQNIHASLRMATTVRQYFQMPSTQKRLDCHGPFGIPLKPLVGIVAPAIVVELGLSNDDQWQDIVDDLQASICAACQC